MSVSVKEKLNQIADTLGYPFAIRATSNRRDVKGVEAWACNEDQPTDREIAVFRDWLEADEFNSGDWLYEDVAAAAYFVNDGDVTKF